MGFIKYRAERLSGELTVWRSSQFNTSYVVGAGSGWGAPYSGDVCTQRRRMKWRQGVVEVPACRDLQGVLHVTSLRPLSPSLSV